MTMDQMAYTCSIELAQRISSRSLSHDDHWQYAGAILHCALRTITLIFIPVRFLLPSRLMPSMSQQDAPFSSQSFTCRSFCDCVWPLMAIPQTGSCRRLPRLSYPPTSCAHCSTSKFGCHQQDASLVRHVSGLNASCQLATHSWGASSHLQG